MAKCIRKGNEFKRVSNVEAKRLVEKEKWKYCTKSEWQRSFITEEKDPGNATRTRNYR